MTATVDPITLEVVCEGLIAIVREMRATVIRASYSPVIWDMDDFSCALFDAQGQMVAQSEDHPGHVLPMLPEELSAHWLSLMPREERLCLTVELRIDAEGRVTAADVYESLIRSWARLNYDEVADFLDRGVVSEAMEPVREVMPWFRAR